MYALTRAPVDGQRWLRVSVETRSLEFFGQRDVSASEMMVDPLADVLHPFMAAGTTS